MSTNATAPLGAKAGSLDPRSVDGKVAAVRDLFAAATENSRLAKTYHSRARSQFKKLRQFVRDLEAMGIEVVLEEPTQQPQSPRRQSDDRNTRSDA